MVIHGNNSKKLYSISASKPCKNLYSNLKFMINLGCRTRGFYALLTCLVFTLSPSAKILAQGNLLVSPKRLIFEGAKKTQELNLANTGTDTAVYLISVKEIRMTENGSFEEVLQPDPGQRFASKYLRFFPRTVSLAPNEAQTIKVQLTKTAELTPGEYRSHIYFRAVPNMKPLGEAANGKDTGISVKLVPVFGITIPAIIRVGDNNAKVQLSDISLVSVNDTSFYLNTTLNRSGDMSVYGDLVVEYIPEQGKGFELGSARGIAVYTPNALRRFRLDMTTVKGFNMHKGRLHVVFSRPFDDKAIKPSDPSSAILAETDYQLH